MTRSHSPKLPDDEQGDRLSRVVVGPVLCLVVGVPGSGKTTLCESLAATVLNASYLSKDMVQSPLTEERDETTQYSLISTPTQRILIGFAQTCLRLNKLPIIDAPMSINHSRGGPGSDWCAYYRSAAAQSGSSLAIIRLRPPDEETHRQRLKVRGLARDQIKLENWEKFRSTEPVNFPIAHDKVLDLVTETSQRHLVREVLGFLAKIDPVRRQNQ